MKHIKDENDVKTTSGEIVGEKHYLPDLTRQTQEDLVKQIQGVLREGQKTANDLNEHLDLAFEGHLSHNERKAYRMALKKIQEEEDAKEEDAKKFKVRTLTYAYCRSDPYERIGDEEDVAWDWSWYFSTLKVEKVILADDYIKGSVENIQPTKRPSANVNIYSSPTMVTAVPIFRDKSVPKGFDLIEYLEKLGRKKK